jgi:uncharacterized protein with von Willebrand factor type A (vWA) domain
VPDAPEALRHHVCEQSVDALCDLAGACLVKGEAKSDKFDQASGEYFKGTESVSGFGAEIPADC